MISQKSARRSEVSRNDYVPAPRTGMVWIRSGQFLMGSNSFYPEEAPVRPMSVDGFWIDTKPVTNRQFEAFVNATGWVTEAELPADPDDYPGAPPERLEPASLVFTPTRGPVDLTKPANWWSYRTRANWRQPYGPGSTLNDLHDHPVVHVSWRDAAAYALWSAADLPTEAEWEFAARGGRDGLTYAWGDSLNPGGRQLANTWQGVFPYQNRAMDGWEQTSPVGFYPANGYGIYDMIGNVWEWTSDRWSLPADVSSSGSPDIGLAGADFRHGCGTLQKVIKGGSHLSAPNYCRRYRPAARLPHPMDASTTHVGFRCVVRPPK